MGLPRKTCKPGVGPCPNPHLTLSPSLSAMLRDNAVQSAKHAFREWAALPAGRRRDIMNKVRPLQPLLDFRFFTNDSDSPPISDG